MALIALGVTGGIGAYKAVEIARGLQQQGHEVVAIMTRSARRFVQPLTFEAITRREVITDLWKPGTNAEIEHIAIASSIDLLLVAPATANTLGKFAHGIADDFLTSMYLATTAPVVVAPAMNSNMFAHPAVVENLAALPARGVRVVEPGSGYLACGWIGKGRLAEPQDVVAVRAAACCSPGDDADRPAGAGDGRTDLREHRSRAVHRQPGERPHGRGAGLRGAAARGRGDTGDRPDVDRHAAGGRSRARAQRRRDARGGDGARGRAGRGDHGRRGGRLHARTRRRRRSPSPRGRSRCRCRARGTSSPMSARCRRGPRDGRCSLASPRKPTTYRPRARQAAQKEGRPHRRQRRVAPGCGFEADTNAVTIVSADDAEDVPLQSKEPWPAAFSIASSRCWPVQRSASRQSDKRMSERARRAPGVLRRPGCGRRQPRSGLARAGRTRRPVRPTVFRPDVNRRADRRWRAPGRYRSRHP